jgi:large subunit ribosomal protein L6
MFSGFVSRTATFASDASGFAYITPVQQLHFPLDTRFFLPRLWFAASRSQLFTLFANLSSIYNGLHGGYFCVLHVKGIGFKVFYSFLRRALYFFLGYNHVTKYQLLPLVTIKPLKNHLLIFTFRNDLFGSSVYHIRHLRFPDPYRGKGIRYRYQIMHFKPGKQR